jgi:NADH-ubiquinone oxidoreductase chain 2
MIFISILILIVAIALPSFNKHLSPILFSRISPIIFLYAGALSFNALYIQSIGSGIGIYSGLFHVTFVSQLLEVFLFIIGSLILIAWPLKTKFVSNLNTKSEILPIIPNSSKIVQDTINKTNYATEYSLIVLFSTFGASLLISSADLISMYLSIELQSFGLYILATLYRDSESATSAGLKYFLLGGLSSCLILLGAGLIYTFTGLTNFESIYSLISVSDSYNIIQGLSLGFILIFVGFLFKIAAAPLHNWAPDVYDDSPTIVTIWLTIMPKISILIFLLELQTQIGYTGNGDIYSISSGLDLLNSFTSINNQNLTTNIITGENTAYLLKNLLLISSLLSLIIGTIVGLAQTRIKRLLAYSTISHIGFILLALSINTEQSIDSLIFYIIQYTITNLNVFLIIIALGYIINNSVHHLIQKEAQISKNHYLNNKVDTDIKFISEFKGQFFFNPLLSLSLSICLFSMAGIPPLIGFFSKQFVLSSAIENGYYFMAIVAILVSVISASYYLKIIKILHTETEENILNETYKINSLIEEGHEYDSIYAETLSSKTISTSSNIDLETKIVNKQEDSLLSNFHSFLISSLTLTILLFVLKPSIILNSTQLLSLSLFNN